MNDTTKWVYFTLDLIPTKRKTSMWHVVSTKGNIFLGSIKYFTKWRTYVFEPGIATLFNADCLSEIWAFIRLENDKRKKELLRKKK